MVDDYSNIDVYLPVKVINGKAKRDISMVLFSKDTGYGDASYYVYSTISRKFFKEDNVMRFLIANRITKLAKFTSPNKKGALINNIGKTITDSESAKAYDKMISRNRNFSL